MNQKQKDTLNKFIGTLEEIKSEVENAQSEEQDKFDNMSEGLQQTERGQAIEQAASDLGDVVNSLENAISELTNVVGM